MRFLTLICAALAGLWVSAALANPQQKVQTYASDLGNQALAIIKAQGSDADKQKKLEALFVENVDIPWIGQFVLGKHWRTITPEQQKRYLQHYQNFVVKYYTANFSNYAGQTFKVISAREDAPGEYLLSMALVHPTDQTKNVMIDYRVRSQGQKFRIFDIIVEGVSLITTQRSEFGSVVSRQGLEHLILQLEKRSQQAAKPAKKAA